jgi:hypothetical protein
LKYLVLDTEDNGGENNERQVFHIVFFDGEIYQCFTQETREQAISFLQGFSKFIKCYCVNLEYDLINLFGTTERIIKSGKLLYGKANLISFEFKKIIFIDTLNHWKLGVQKMGEILEIPKLKFSPTSLDYCKRDCEITWLYVAKMLYAYDSIKMKIKRTIASTALNYYKENFLPIKFKRIKPKNLEYFRNFYFGGRTECFYIGEFFSEKDKDIHCIDVNSLYPFCMTKNYPNPFIFFESKKPEMDFYLIHAKVKSALKIPILPKRINNKLCFPNGEIEGYFTNIEIEYFLELGGKIERIYNCINFPVLIKPFDEYVLKLYGKRKQAENIYENQMFKLLLNSLYGKFGQDNEIYVIDSMKKYLENYEKIKTKEVTPILNNEYVKYIEILSEFPYNTNFIWSLYTTSYGRLELYKLLEFVDDTQEKLLYCDTDSVIYRGTELKGNEKLGAYKNEWKAKHILIKNVKEYYFDTDTNDLFFKIKGIGRKDKYKSFEYIHGLNIMEKKPISLKQSLYGFGKGKENIWTEQEKKSFSEYQKGDLLDGKVYPYIIFE